MTTAEGVQFFRAALVTIGSSTGTPHDRLQRAWTNQVQHVWEARHVDGELADRFRALWEAYTGDGDDPHRTNLRDLSDGEIDLAVGQLVDLALDVAAARAVEAHEGAAGT